MESVGVLPVGPEHRQAAGGPTSTATAGPTWRSTVRQTAAGTSATRRLATSSPSGRISSGARRATRRSSPTSTATAGPTSQSSGHPMGGIMPLLVAWLRLQPVGVAPSGASPLTSCSDRRDSGQERIADREPNAITGPSRAQWIWAGGQLRSERYRMRGDGSGQTNLPRKPSCRSLAASSSPMCHESSSAYSG